MNQKPSDLYLGIIDFFGALIPGAIFVFLNYKFIGKIFTSSMPELDSIPIWIPLFIVSYILGHFLLGLSHPLNYLAVEFLKDPTKNKEKTVRECMKQSNQSSGELDSMDLFYSVFSFIRIKSPEALIELERQTAEYKLFRSLTLLFLIEILLSVSSDLKFSRPLEPWISVIILLFAAYRFWWLFDWTYRLAYDFYLQINQSTN